MTFMRRDHVHPFQRDLQNFRQFERIFDDQGGKLRISLWRCLRAGNRSAFRRWCATASCVSSLPSSPSERTTAATMPVSATGAVRSEFGRTTGTVIGLPGAGGFALLVEIGAIPPPADRL